jgi:hypothetical protein
MAKPISLKTPLTEDQVACVDALQEALAEAMDGNVDTVGIAVCMKSGYGTVMAGSRAGDLNLACDSLKKKILDAVENSDKTKTVSRIARI